MSRQGKTGQANVLSDKDLDKVLRDIRGGNPKTKDRNTCIIILSHFLGLRAKELAALKVSDVCDDKTTVKKVLKLRAAYTKGNKHRDVPLTNKKVIQAIESLLSGIEYNKDAPLFRSQKDKFSANTMVQLIKNIYKSAGFENCSSHSGRRSMITKLANKGVDVNSIRIIAGHSSINTTQRYIESDPEMLANIMQGL